MRLMSVRQWTKNVGVVALLVATSGVQATDRWDWSEGGADGAGGATREFYNAAASLRWRHANGDWRDRNGEAQGKLPYAETTVASGKAELAVTLDVTALVKAWLADSVSNRGMLLQVGNGNGGTIRFASRENPQASLQPRLQLQFSDGLQTLAASADTHLDPSTYKAKGKTATLTISTGGHPALLQFELAALQGRQTRLQKAELQLTAVERSGGNSKVQVFAIDIPAPMSEAPRLGLASQFVGDTGINRHPDVIYATGFDDSDFTDQWPEFRGHYWLTARAEQFAPLHGNALQVRLEKGDNYGATGSLKFQPLLGAEPEQMYVRYYLRLGANWRPRTQGGKLPGFAGTYGKGGWGGRPNNGRNGWSARGAFLQQIGEGNPLAGRTPIGTYIYETGKSADFGAVWAWSEGEGAYLENNRWYCVEQFIKLNTPGQDNGELQAWLDGREVFHRRDLRLRLVPELKIEKFWFDIYHGGTMTSPIDQDLYFDNLVVARSYIGPMAEPSAQRSGHASAARE